MELPIEFKLKYMEEYIPRYQEMIEADRSLIKVLSAKKLEFQNNADLCAKIDEQINNSLENIEHYKQQINELIGG